MHITPNLLIDLGNCKHTFSGHLTFFYALPKILTKYHIKSFLERDKFSELRYKDVLGFFIIITFVSLCLKGFKPLQNSFSSHHETSTHTPNVSLVMYKHEAYK